MKIDSEKLKKKIEELRADSVEDMEFYRMTGIDSEGYYRELGYSSAFFVVLNLIEKMEKEDEGNKRYNH